MRARRSSLGRIYSDGESTFPVVGTLDSTVKIACRFDPIHFECPVAVGKHGLHFDRDRLAGCTLNG